MCKEKENGKMRKCFENQAKNLLTKKKYNPRIKLSKNKKVKKKT